jgi:hypothetical protein
MVPDFGSIMCHVLFSTLLEGQRREHTTVLNPRLEHDALVPENLAETANQQK